MKITTVLFDLDGTLLPLDQDYFIKTYFTALSKKISPLGYEPSSLVNSIWVGIKAMMENDGVKTNEQIFWDSFAAVCGKRILDDYPAFEDFYRNDFDREVRPSCGYDPNAARAVHFVKDSGFTVALATNPVFPAIATEARIKWAGLSPSDFALYTTYENSHYSKPVLNYYREVIEKLGVSAEECLMVGNDVSDDMVVRELGMKVFLLTNNLINKNGEDISVYPNGGYDELIEYVKTINN